MKDTEISDGDHKLCHHNNQLMQPRVTTLVHGIKSKHYRIKHDLQVKTRLSA